MLYFLIFYIIPVLATMRIINYLRVSNKALETEYHFKQLHFKLIQLAIDNKNYIDDSRFQFLDFTLSNSKIALKRLNFWVILYRSIVSRKQSDKSFFDFEKGMAHDTKLREIYNDFTRTSILFFLSKSKFSVSIFTTFLKVIKFCVKTVEGTKVSKSVVYKRKMKYFIIDNQATFAGVSPSFAH